MSLAAPQYATGAAIQPLPISPIQIDGVVLADARIKSMQIESSVGNHEVLKLVILLPILDSSYLLSKPIYLRYGLNPEYGYFYGYTSNVSKPQTNQTTSQIEITALGFSSILKLSPSRVFMDMSTQQILSEVLKGSDDYPYRIGLGAQEHNYKHQRMAQVGETDWEFIVRVASMAGFYLYPYCGAIVMSHPIRALDNGVAYRVLEKSTQTLDNQPLLDFIPNERTDNTKEDFEPEFSYFTTTGLQNFIPDKPPHRRTKIRDYIYSPGYAQFIADGMKIMTGMYQTATARIRGDAFIRPGAVVDIRTGASRGAIDSFDGIWYVNYVSTHIDEKVYQTGIRMCRDKYRAAKSGLSQYFYENDSRNFPTMSLHQGAWKSSWSN